MQDTRRTIVVVKVGAVVYRLWLVNRLELWLVDGLVLLLVLLLELPHLLELRLQRLDFGLEALFVTAVLCRQQHRTKSDEEVVTEDSAEGVVRLVPPRT